MIPRAAAALKAIEAFWTKLSSVQVNPESQ